jgi:hypothetical protein
LNDNNNNFSIETGWKPVIRENSLEGLTVVGKIEKDYKNISKQCEVAIEKSELSASLNNTFKPDKDESKHKIHTQSQNEELLKIYDKIDSVKNDIDKKLDRLSQDIDVLISIILENSTRQEPQQKKAPFANFLKKLGIHR